MMLSTNSNIVILTGKRSEYGSMPDSTKVKGHIRIALMRMTCMNTSVISLVNVNSTYHSTATNSINTYVTMPLLQ